MGLRHTDNRFGWPARVLHWVIAVLILGMIFLGFFMGNASKPLLYTLIGIHKSIGLLILFLVILRLLWLCIDGKPSLPAGMTAAEKFLARLVHGLLYVALVCMPVSGIIMSVAAGHPPKFFGLFTVTLPIAKNRALAEAFSNIHSFWAWTLVWLLVLHIVGVLYHTFVKKDRLIKRMV